MAINKTSRGSQQPTEYLRELNNASAEFSRSFSAPTAPAPAAGGGQNLSGMMASYMAFQQKVNSIISEQTLSMQMLERDNETLSEKLEELSTERDKLKADLEAVPAATAKLNEGHAAALKTASDEATTAKQALETKLADLTKELETLQASHKTMVADLEKASADLKALAEERDKLKTDNEELKKDNEKLGANKLGLPTVKSVADKTPAAGMTTEKGNPVAPVKTMSAAELSAAQKTPETQSSVATANEPSLADLQVVLTDYVTLRSKSRNGGADMRAFIAFNSGEPIADCEGCKADKLHHKKLIDLALSRRDEIARFAAAS